MKENKSSLNKSFWLLVIAGVLFVISALGQGFCAIPEIKNAIRNLPSYWSNRIYMYALLVNLSMWITASLVFYGAYALTRGKKSHFVILTASLYSLLMSALILILTPSDWWHTITLYSGTVLIFLCLIFQKSSN